MWIEKVSQPVQNLPFEISSDTWLSVMQEATSSKAALSWLLGVWCQNIDWLRRNWENRPRANTVVAETFTKKTSKSKTRNVCLDMSWHSGQIAECQMQLSEGSVKACFGQLPHIKILTSSGMVCHLFKNIHLQRQIVCTVQSVEKHWCQMLNTWMIFCVSTSFDPIVSRSSAQPLPSCFIQKSLKILTLGRRHAESAHRWRKHKTREGYWIKIKSQTCRKAEEWGSCSWTIFCFAGQPNRSFSSLPVFASRCAAFRLCSTAAWLIVGQALSLKRLNVQCKETTVECSGFMFLLHLYIIPPIQKHTKQNHSLPLSPLQASPPLAPLPADLLVATLTQTVVAVFVRWQIWNVELSMFVLKGLLSGKPIQAPRVLPWQKRMLEMWMINYGLN